MASGRHHLNEGNLRQSNSRTNVERKYALLAPVNWSLARPLYENEAQKHNECNPSADPCQTNCYVRPLNEDCQYTNVLILYQTKCPLLATIPNEVLCNASERKLPLCGCFMSNEISINRLFYGKRTAEDGCLCQHFAHELIRRTTERKPPLYSSLMSKEMSIIRLPMEKNCRRWLSMSIYNADGDT